MGKEHELDADPNGLFLARDSVNIGKILAVHGSPDDVYDIQQGFIPYGPLFLTLIGFFGMSIAIAQRTADSLTIAMGFLFAGGLGLYRLMTQSRYKATAVRRSELMRIEEASASHRGTTKQNTPS